MASTDITDSGEQPVIPLAEAPGEHAAWPSSKLKVYAWAAIELVLVSSSWQISSKLRIWALRKFGATIGEGVIFRPRTRVKFPWNLRVEDNCWIGEGVWFHNQDRVHVGHDCVVSQETMLTTGSHAHRTDMALLTAPIVIEPGTWITSRCLILGGTTIRRNSLVSPMSVVRGDFDENVVIAGNPGRVVSARFPR